MESRGGEEQVRVGTSNMAKWLMRIMCAIALLFVGFAHQAPAFANGTFIAPEFAEYVLPDGTLPVICIAGKVEGKHTHDKAHAAKCEACRTSVLLPAPGSGGIERLLIEANDASRVEVVVFHRELLPRSRGARAPPGNLASA
jgi:hypothetical protein